MGDLNLIMNFEPSRHRCRMMAAAGFALPWWGIMRSGQAKLWLGCVFLLAAVCSPPAARAQGAPAQGDPMEIASPQDKAAARQKYQEGKQAFGAGKFDDALAGFRASYEIVPSPNSHLMVVNTLVEMGKHSEAYSEAEAVATEAEAAAAAGHAKYQATADAARRTMEWLRSRIGLVTVTVKDAEPGAALIVNDKPVNAGAWGSPLPVEPGQVTVVLSSTQGEERREVTVQPGGEASVTIGPAPPVEPEPVQPDEPVEESAGFNPFDQSDNQRLVAYITGGVGATGMILFAILGGAHLAQYSDLEDQCPNNQCPPELEEDADSGRGLQTGANVMLVVGLVGLAGGAALFFTTDWFIGGSEDESAEEARFRPTVTVGPGSIGIRGTF